MKRVSILIIFLLSLSIVSAINFDELKDNYKVGEEIVISGNADGDSIDLTFECDGEAVDLWNVPIEGGLFNKETELTNDKIGNCVIVGGINGDEVRSSSFNVNDVNSEPVVEPEVDILVETTTVSTPSVVNTIGLTANINRNIYKPGNELFVSGASDKENVDIVVGIDGKQFVSQQKEFKIKYILPKNIKSGEHDILVEAKDNSGNYGRLNLKYYIEAVPTSLELNMADSYGPGSYVSLITKVYDQAGYLISGKYTVYVYDGFTKVLLEEHALNEEVKMKLGDFAKPGIRKVKVVAFGLTKEKDFIVNEIKKLDITLNGDVLVIKNIGNADYEEELVVKGNEIIKGKNLYLGINEVSEVDLSSLFSDGNYNINIPFTGQTFENVQVDKGGIFSGIGTGVGGVTGMAVFNVKKTYTNYGYFIICGLILLVVMLIFLNIRYRKKSIDRARAKEYMHGQKRLKEIQNLKPESSRRYDFGKPTNDDAEYFKNTVVKEYQENEKHERLYGRPKSESSNTGLFNMFK